MAGVSTLDAVVSGVAVPEAHTSDLICVKQKLLTLYCENTKCLTSSAFIPFFVVQKVAPDRSSATDGGVKRLDISRYKMCHHHILNS